MSDQHTDSRRVSPAAKRAVTEAAETSLTQIRDMALSLTLLTIPTGVVGAALVGVTTASVVNMVVVLCFMGLLTAWYVAVAVGSQYLLTGGVP